MSSRYLGRYQLEQIPTNVFDSGAGKRGLEIAPPLMALIDPNDNMWEDDSQLGSINFCHLKYYSKNCIIL